MYTLDPSDPEAEFDIRDLQFYDENLTHAEVLKTLIEFHNGLADRQGEEG